MSASAIAWLGKMSIDGRVGKALAPVTDLVLSRRFSSSSRLRVQVYYTRSRISFSQIYPLLRHAGEITTRFDADIRFHDVERLLSGQLTPMGADVVIVQPWFTCDRQQLQHAMERIRGANPRARIVFMDSYAHNDLRFAALLDPFIDLYVKKSLFRDRARYFRPTLGDTNLTDFYGWQYGMPEPKVDWQVPRSIVPKLTAGANFFTAPALIKGFLGAPPDPTSERPIDLHARLETRGTPWYAAMRSDCVRRAEAMDARTVTGAGLPWAAYIAELGSAKAVFSPFGYGEICWRDIEGFMTGAVVVKQDMGHLETRPDLYRAWETYVPVAWDFSDLEANVRRVLDDAALRTSIATNAWRAVQRYLTEERLVSDLAPLFGDGVPVPRRKPAVNGPALPAPAMGLRSVRT